MAETCRFSQQHSTRTGTIEEQVSWGPCCCFRFWCDWRGKEDPSVNPGNTANLLSAWKSQGVNTVPYRVKKATRTREGDWSINLLFFLKLGNSETNHIPPFPCQGRAIIWISNAQGTEYTLVMGPPLHSRSTKGLQSQQVLCLTTAFVLAVCLQENGISRAKLL